METASRLCLVLTSWPIERDTDALAAALVTDGLAACVSVLAPMTSHYMWQGVLERTQERQLVIKTTRAVLATLLERLQAAHPYDLPECVVLDAHASAAYGEWVAGATRTRD